MKVLEFHSPVDAAIKGKDIVRYLKGEADIRYIEEIDRDPLEGIDLEGKYEMFIVIRKANQ